MGAGPTFLCVKKTKEPGAETIVAEKRGRFLRWRKVGGVMIYGGFNEKHLKKVDDMEGCFKNFGKRAWEEGERTTLVTYI